MRIPDITGFGTLQAVGERLLVAERKKVWGEGGGRGKEQRRHVWEAGFGSLQALGERLPVAESKKVGAMGGKRSRSCGEEGDAGREEEGVGRVGGGRWWQRGRT